MVSGSDEDDVSRRRRRQVGRLRLLSVMSAHIMLHHMHTHTHTPGLLDEAYLRVGIVIIIIITV